MSTNDLVSLVHRVAHRFNIDGRAIIGAIEWELRYNPRGWLSDLVQTPIAVLFDERVGNGVGWGSMHWDTADTLRASYPEDPTLKECTRSTRAIAACLDRLDTAMYMIGAEMNRAAEAYERHAQFFIRDRPEILAALYHLGKPDEKAKALRARREHDPTAQPGVGNSAMGQFILDHLREFTLFKTNPSRPLQLPPELDLGIRFA